MNLDNLIPELSFKAVRGSGPGGQHVNKVSTKIELQFDLHNSKVLDAVQKEILQTKLASRLTTKGVLIIACDDTRSQYRNKEIAIKRFKALIKEALKKPKKRKASAVPKAVKLKRLKEKQKQSEKKQHRKKPDLDS